MALTYTGLLDVVFILGDSSEVQTRVGAVLTQPLRGGDLSFAEVLPAAQRAELVCVTLDTGYSLGGAVTAGDGLRLTFSRPRQ